MLASGYGLSIRISDLTEGDYPWISIAEGFIDSLAFSADSRELVGANGLEIIRWEAASGAEVQKVAASALRLASFGDFFVRLLGRDLVSLEILDARSCEPVCSLDQEGQVEHTRAFAFSPDGGSLAACGIYQLITWDAIRGNQRVSRLWESGPIAGLAASPTEPVLVSAGGGSGVAVWRPDAISVVARIPAHGPRSVAFFPGGDRFAFADFLDGITVWDLDTNSARCRIFRVGEVLCVWDSETAESDLAKESIFGRTFNAPNGEPARMVVVEPIRTSEQRNDLDFGGAVADWGLLSFVSVLPDGESLAIADHQGNAAVYNLRTRASEWLRISSSSRDCAGGLTFSRDNRSFAIGLLGRVEVFSECGRTYELRLPRMERRYNAVRAVAFAPNGYLLAGSTDGAVRIWSLVKPHVEGRLRHTYMSGKREVEVKDIGIVDDVLTLHHPAEVTALAVAPDGNVIASASNREIRLWEASTGALLASLGGHTDWITALTFLADGRLLASGSRDGTVRLWSAP